jgi:hypothetical protein
MGVTTEILSLRGSHFSSVTELIYALEQVRYSPPEKICARIFLAGSAADLVLTNVAAHAAEALNDLQTTPRPIRRTATASRRTSRRSDGLKPRQRMLFR